MSRSPLRAAGAIVCAIQIVASLDVSCAAEVVNVTLKDHRFQPRLIEAKPGQVIVFSNQDKDLHSVVVADLVAETFVDPGKSFSIVVPNTMRRGDYPLACTIHVDMTGSLRVLEP